MPPIKEHNGSDVSEYEEQIRILEKYLEFIENEG